MTSAREIIIIGWKYRRRRGAFASCSACAFHLATAGEVIESVLFCCHPLCLKVAQVANSRHNQSGRAGRCFVHVRWVAVSSNRHPVEF